MKMRSKYIVALSLLQVFLVGTEIINGPRAWAAVGCTLNDPDRDIRRLFPESTGYKTHFITILERGGKALADRVEKKLGDSLEPVYETLDVPYAYYQVFKGKEHIGWVFGVNQKGEYGGIQMILTTDLNGKILDFYYQRFSSPDAGKFRQKSFTGTFKNLTLKEMESYDPRTGEVGDSGSLINKIENPSQRNEIDFKATMRGIKKNLVLFYIFWKEDK
jgi:hypothetical protein